jgi:peptide deformylase
MRVAPIRPTRTSTLATPNWTPTSRAAAHRVVLVFNAHYTRIRIETRTFFEGCRSVDGVRGAVDRALEIEVSFVDEYGEARLRHVRGCEARILEHEIDHLDGVLYVDLARERR